MEALLLLSIIFVVVSVRTPKWCYDVTDVLIKTVIYWFLIGGALVIIQELG